MGRYKALLLLLPINHTIQSWHRQPATSFCSPPPPPAPPPTYLSIISSPRNISMTNIYSRDGASGRTSPAPHLSCVKSCNQPAAFPPSVSHNLSCWKILTPNRFFTPNRLLGISNCRSQKKMRNDGGLLVQCPTSKIAMCNILVYINTSKCC